MTRYVFRDGHFRDRVTGEPMTVPAGPLAVPMIAPTMPEYASPIDGRVISTRHERREDLKRNNCVEAGDAGLSPTKGKIRNKAFAAKRGLTVSEEYR
ncbi:hypothetical protein FJ955_03030 [Mesorhizobium sp. B2-2-2]|uniref:hypothetical protein n=1 Tax=Mesorhizobium sp. B2-2-2 TaxID=2589964 RepID=UPI00112A07FA|nr:hypothetical protein [Mesorhizobium sp. B2-2-2]TPM33729.1 hypothetical protein FJ955_03030 [Mesorhizobium sp. B2-2-2]